MVVERRYRTTERSESMLDTLSTKLVVLATTVTGACSAALNSVREYAEATDKLVWATMVWYHEWTVAKMMTHEAGRVDANRPKNNPRYSWSFFPDPDSADTASFEELVNCETGTKNRVYSSLKLASLLDQCRRTGDKTTGAGWSDLCATYGVNSGDDAVRIAGPLARQFKLSEDRSVKQVEEWIAAILNPPAPPETETETEPETEPEPTATNGHDVGATASPTYASIGDRLASALADFRTLTGDPLVTASDDERAAITAAVTEWADELESLTA
jgi:hypothetical protein